MRFRIPKRCRAWKSSSAVNCERIVIVTREAIQVKVLRFE